MCVWCRWWKEAVESISETESATKVGVLYTALPASAYAGAMKIINNIFSSDIVFNLKREDDSAKENPNGDVGISCRDYALVPGEMWLQALKWLVVNYSLPKGLQLFSFNV